MSTTMISIPNNGNGSSSSASSSSSSASSNGSNTFHVATTNGSGGGGGGGGTAGGHQQSSNSIHNSSPTYPSNISSTMLPSVTSRLKKNINRTKEKILQGIGKTDRTSDENFDLYVENFERQHSQASKLTKELNKYISNLKETHKSSRAFYDTLRETYEANWPGSNQFYEQIQSFEQKWTDYLVKLNNDVQMPLLAYLNEFPELKKKIEKRGNRLLDYDNARHTLENLQNKTSKKNAAAAATSSALCNNTPQSTDQLTKLTKLKIDLVDKQTIYEEINQTLCLSLPVLYENRIKFYASLFQTFFHTETLFNSDMLETKSKLDDICEHLTIKSAEEDALNNHNKSLIQQQQQQQQQLQIQQQQQQLMIEPQATVKPAAAAVTINGSGGGGKKLERANSSVVDYNNIKNHNHHHHHHSHHQQNQNDETNSNGSQQQRANSMFVKSSSRSTSGPIAAAESSSLSSSQQQQHENNNGGNNYQQHVRRSSIGTNSNHSKSSNNSGKLLNSYNNGSGGGANGARTEFQPSSMNDLEVVNNNNEHENNHNFSSSIIQSEIVVTAAAADLTAAKININEINSDVIVSSRNNNNINNNHNHQISSSAAAKSNRVCYKVRATYNYEAKELDELTFAKDDIISVVEGSESEKEDLDDGWLIGIHEHTAKRGLFPENFTKRII